MLSINATNITINKVKINTTLVNSVVLKQTGAFELYTGLIVCAFAVPTLFNRAISPGLSLVSSTYTYWEIKSVLTVFDVDAGREGLFAPRALLFLFDSSF